MLFPASRLLELEWSNCSGSSMTDIGRSTFYRGNGSISRAGPRAPRTPGLRECHPSLSNAIGFCSHWHVCTSPQVKLCSVSFFIPTKCDKLATHSNSRARAVERQRVCRRMHVPRVDVDGIEQCHRITQICGRTAKQNPRNPKHTAVHVTRCCRLHNKRRKLVANSRGSSWLLNVIQQPSISLPNRCNFSPLHCGESQRIFYSGGVG
jgi:hypothetical protein